VLLTTSSSFAQLEQYSNSPSVINNSPNLPTSVVADGNNFYAIASDDEGNWSFCSSKQDSSHESNMNHAWEQKTVFSGASLSRIALKPDGLIITGKIITGKYYNSYFLLVSKDCGASWIEERAIHKSNSIGSDDFQYSYKEAAGICEGYPVHDPVHFVSIGSDENEDQSSSFALFFRNNEFIAIGSDSFNPPVDPYYPIGSDNMLHGTSLPVNDLSVELLRNLFL
jgi:hypothetical protein